MPPSSTSNRQAGITKISAPTCVTAATASGSTPRPTRRTNAVYTEKATTVPSNKMIGSTGDGPECSVKIPEATIAPVNPTTRATTDRRDGASPTSSTPARATPIGSRPTTIEPMVAEPRSTPMPMNTAISPMPNIPIRINWRKCSRAVGSRRRAMTTNMTAAMRKRMRFVVAGPKLSLASLYDGRLPPKNTTMVNNAPRTARDAGGEGDSTTAVVVESLIATTTR